MAQKIHYVYHWHRIFAALAALILLICLVAYGVYSWLETENPVEQIQTAATASNAETAPKEFLSPKQDQYPDAQNEEISSAGPPETPDQEQLPQQPSEPGIQSTPAAPVVFDTASPPAVEVKSAVIAVETDTEPSPVQTTLVAEETKIDQPIVIDEVHSARQDDADLVAQPAKRHGSEQAAPPEPPRSGGVFQQQTIKKNSPSVTRFVLARSVVDREPSGSIDSITTDTKGVAVIYSFSEVVDMGGRTLYYQWLHDSEAVAKVKVGVGKDSWRSYSSKYINRHMSGSWRVELRTENGRLLASASFSVDMP